MNPGTDEFLTLPDLAHVGRIALRLMMAAVLGGLVGAERESMGKAAGLRTHMLVALGAALLIIAPAEAGVGEGDIGRIIQGIAAGIGFIGAGTIVKRHDRGDVEGLTTAASIWMTAALGVAVAVGPVWLPVVSVVAALLILFALQGIERKLEGRAKQKR
jgi:putative Mg2+ transporter-C (MgtC) family protein